MKKKYRKKCLFQLKATILQLLTHCLKKNTHSFLDKTKKSQMNNANNG